MNKRETFDIILQRAKEIYKAAVDDAKNDDGSMPAALGEHTKSVLEDIFGRDHIGMRLIEARGADHPEMSQSDYIQFVLSNITRSTEQHIEHGFVTDSGELIGYTQEHSGNIHHVLAVYYRVMMGLYEP